MKATKTMNHSEYQQKLRKKSEKELQFIINDCRATLTAWPDHPNAGYYMDEIHYALAEKGRRREKRAAKWDKF